MTKKAGVIMMGVLFCATLFGGIRSISTHAEDAAKEPLATEVPSATETPAGDATGPAIDVSKITLDKKSIIIKEKKKTGLTIQGTPSVVTWTSANPKVAKVSAKGVVTGVKTGKTSVTASVDGITLTCSVRVVAKMSKKDFGKFTGENFVAFCQRKGYNHGYAWKGQWKGDSKKRSTYRGIKIGASKAKVEKAYGDMTLNKCKASDPFTKMKGLKKNKVRYYNDEIWGKYRIRFYYNKKKSVVAIILACNIGTIKKKDLKSYM